MSSIKTRLHQKSLLVCVAHDLTSLDFDKLANIQDAYKLVGYVLQNSYLSDCVHIAHT